MFSGIHAVLYALFDANERIDAQAMRAQVAYCARQGCHGINILGLATEVLKLTQAERCEMVEIVAKALAGRLPFSVTIAGNSVAEQVAMIRMAEANKADWLILQPPMVGNYDADIYLEFFVRVAEATALPVAIQNAPKYLGRGLSGKDLTRLRQRCANLAAVKSEEEALNMHDLIAEVEGHLVVLGGRGGLEMTDALRAGCHGFILAPDIAPLAVRIYEAWQNDDAARAEKLYAGALPAITFTMQSLEHLITYGKRICAAQIGYEVHDRVPCLSTSAFGLACAERWAAQLGDLLEKKE